MASQVANQELAAAIGAVAAGLDALFAAGVAPADPDDAAVVVAELERLRRRIDAAGVEALAAIDARGLYRVDGHASAKVMVRHVAQLSPGEAAARARSAAALRDLEAVRGEYRAGAVGTCQVRFLAQAHANPRVCDALPVAEEPLLAAAVTSPYREFAARVGEWVRLVDEDGTCDTNQRNHDNRDAAMVRDLDLGWELRARSGALAGAEMETIFRRFIDAERRADWDAARARLGDDATTADLARTDAQRRFDALHRIFRQAVAAPPGSRSPGLVMNLVMDHASFERALARLADATPEPRDPFDVTYRCGTLDGVALEPVECVAASLLAHIRRVVLGADRVVIDTSRTRRLFTGPARLAAQLAATECYWPGCHVPVTACQIDHLRPWAPDPLRDDGGGPTDQANAGPVCGRHNRLKHRGYHTWRDPTGTWHTHRPDGTEIT